MRRNIELFINGSRVDLDAEALILFNYRFEELSNPTIVKNSYSQTITLKDTDANNRIFGEFFRSDRMVSAALFDPKRKVPFQIFEDGTLLESGYAKLEQVVTKGGTAREYKVGLFGGLGSFFYALSYDDDGNKKTLASLDYPRSLDFVINAANVAAAWAYLTDAPYSGANRWDIINFAPCYNGVPSDDFDADKMIISPSEIGLRTSIQDGDKTYTTPVSGLSLAKLGRKVNEWEAHDLRSYLQRAVLRFRAVLDACCDPDQNGGFTVNLDPTFFNNDNSYYDKLWLALPQIHQLNGLAEGDSGTFEIPATGGTGEFEALVDLSIPFGTQVQISIGAQFVAVLNDGYTGGTLYSSQIDGTGAQATCETYCWLIQAVGYDQNGAAVTGSPVEIIQSPVGAVRYTAERVAREVGFVPFYNAGYDTQDLDGAFEYTGGEWVWNKDLQFAFTGNNVSRIGLRVMAVRVFDNQQQPGPVFVEVNNTIKVFETQTSDPNTAHTLAEAHLQGIAGANTYEYGTASSVRSGATITKAALLSTDYSPADYLISYAKIFGLQFMVDREAKEITIMTRDTFFAAYQNDVIDLTDRVDRSQDMQTTPFSIASKWLELSFEEEEVEWAKEYLTAYGRKYGAARIDTGFEFNAETKELLEGLAFKGGVEVLERSKMYNNLTEAGKPVPSAFLDSGEYTLYSGDDSKAFPLSVPTAAAIISYFNDTYLSYDRYSKAQFHGPDQSELDLRDVLLFYRGKVYHDTEYWQQAGFSRMIITDDDSAMSDLNDNVPCWRGTYAGGVYRALEYYPLFGRYIYAGANIVRSLDFGMPAEIDIPGVNFAAGAGIYERFWRRFLSDRYDDDACVMECSIDLSGMQVDADLLRRFYYYDGAIWSLNAIKNHSLTTFDPTKCELVKVIDIQNYTNGQAQEGSALTAYPASITLDPYGSTETITVTAEGAWTVAAVDLPGVTLSAQGGTGSSQITVTAVENAGTALAGYLLFTLVATGATCRVDVAQNVPGQDSVSPMSLEFAAPGDKWDGAFVYSGGSAYGQYEIQVTPDAPQGAWRVTSEPEWMELNIYANYTYYGPATVVAHARPNYSQTARTGALVFQFTHGAETVTKTVQVTQRADLWAVMEIDLADMNGQIIDLDGSTVNLLNFNSMRVRIDANSTGFTGMRVDGLEVGSRHIAYPELSESREDTYIDDGGFFRDTVGLESYNINLAKSFRCYAASIGGLGQMQSRIWIGNQLSAFTDLYITPAAAQILPYLSLSAREVTIAPDGSAFVDVGTNSFWIVYQSDLYDARALVFNGVIQPAYASYLEGNWPWHSDGPENGVRIQPTLNTTGATRDLRVTFFTGDADINGQVLQGGILATLLLHQQTMLWDIEEPAAQPAAAGWITLHFTSNLENQTIGLQELSASSSESWCIVHVNGTWLPVEVELQQNTTGQARTATVSVHCDRDNTTKTVTITQEA